MKKTFRGHTDASNSTVRGTLTELDEVGKDRVIAYHSKNLSSVERNYSTNDRELHGIIYFLMMFSFSREGSDIEIFTDNQVLKRFFTKAKLIRREARWLETLGNFGIFPINLKPGKIHVIGDTLSRAPNASVNVDEVLKIDSEGLINCYAGDKFYREILKKVNGDKNQIKFLVKDS